MEKTIKTSAAESTNPTPKIHADLAPAASVGAGLTPQPPRDTDTVPHQEERLDVADIAASLTVAFGTGSAAPRQDGSNSAHVRNLDPHAPVGERIDLAYVRSLESAMDAVRWVIVGGTLLLDQKKITPHGQWLKWLSENCKQVSEDTAERMMKATAYVFEKGTFNAQSIRQLYLEAGVLKAAEDGEDSGPSPERSVLLPFQDTFKKLRLFYTDDRLASLKPAAVPQLLGYVRDVRAELTVMEERLLKRMPAAGPQSLQK